MTFTRAIGVGCNKIIRVIVRGLALSRIHPNALTFIGLLINVGAAALLARGQFFKAGLVIIGAGIFDMVDGRVARETNQVTRFGGFFDPFGSRPFPGSVQDPASDDFAGDVPEPPRELKLDAPLDSQAFVRVVATADVQPGSFLLARLDLLLLALSPGLESTPWRLERIVADNDRPLVLVGSPAEVLTARAELDGQVRDFLTVPVRHDELLVRAGRALERAAIVVDPARVERPVAPPYPALWARPKPRRHARPPSVCAARAPALPAAGH